MLVQRAGRLSALGRSTCLAMFVALLASGGLWAQTASPPQRASRTKAQANRPTKADDLTFRPTVKLRKGNSCGTGSLIASQAGETLILTAAHVVEGPGELLVELHRYNVGLERNEPGVGWPKTYTAEVVQADKEADVALVSLFGVRRLPHLAALAEKTAVVKPGQHVVSVGIDRGERLQSWETRVQGQVQLNRGGEGKVQPFLVTEKAPEHGRSGGGLFRDDGRLVGVCVGRIELDNQPAVGLFASLESVRRLLKMPAAADTAGRFPSLATFMEDRPR